MLNVHRRLFAASADQIRPWIARAWSGVEGDIFPRDAIRSWRKNPQGVDPLALVPGVTRVGHGMFSFRFGSWDGTFWRVRIESAAFRGWHGFDLRPVAGRCELTHTIDAQLSGSARAVWPAFIAPIHDWCVEAMFDRLEEALRTGAVPRTSDRPMPMRAKLALTALRKVAKAGGRTDVRRQAMVTSLE